MLYVVNIFQSNDQSKKIFVFSADMPKIDFDGLSQRILNGTKVGMPLPYQVRIELGFQHWCGGVLISPNFILTAFNFLHNQDPKDPKKALKIPKKNFTIWAGAYTKNDQRYAQRRFISRPIPSKYSDGTRDHGTKWYHPDIMIVQVDEPFQINSNVTPACLPTKPVPLNTTCIVVSGWGNTKPGSDTLGIGSSV